METYIALLRGINVGGQLLLMKELAPLFEKLGCASVKTYIQSGNVVFRASPANVKTLEKRLGAAIQKLRGFEPRTMVLQLKELERAATGNPYPQADEKPQSLHIIFLADVAKQADLAALRKLMKPNEQCELRGKVFYFYAPDGIGDSKAAAKIDKCLGVTGTGRNWRTVNKLIEMARALS
jgi:uncharacterized protein (DUF1697 family)